MKTKLSGMSKK